MPKQTHIDRDYNPPKDDPETVHKDANLLGDPPIKTSTPYPPPEPTPEPAAGSDPDAPPMLEKTKDEMALGAELVKKAAARAKDDEDAQ